MNSGTPSRDTIALAGWLFADLLLGLGLLFFVAGSKGTPPAPTPTITPTASLTYTPTSTITRLPTYTPYPTFTPIYTFTPYPTFTPLPPNLTYTPYPTFTPIPPEWTYTPYPTYTQPAPLATYTQPPPLATYTRVPALPTYTPYPTVIYGLNGTPFTANFSVSPATARGLLTGSAQARAQLREEMRTQLRPQVQLCLARFNDVSRVGVALIFGTDSSPTIGNRLAEETASILSEEYPRIFDGTVMKTYHFISGDSSAVGQVEVELYFVGETGSEDPFTPLDSSCNP